MAENKELKTYNVAITETLRKIVAVEAFDEADARQRVSDGWKNADYILDAESFEGVEFHVVGESETEEAEKK